MANFGLRGLCQSDVTCAQSSSTSIELKGFPLYASMNSAASDGFENLMTTIDLFGAVSLPRSIVSMALPHILSTAYLIILRCDIPSPAGATEPEASAPCFLAGRRCSGRWAQEQLGLQPRIHPILRHYEGAPGGWRVEAGLDGWRQGGFAGSDCGTHVGRHGLQARARATAPRRTQGR